MLLLVLAPAAAATEHPVSAIRYAPSGQGVRPPHRSANDNSVSLVNPDAGRVLKSFRFR